MATTPVEEQVRTRWFGLTSSEIIERLEQRLAERNRTNEELRAELLEVKAFAEAAAADDPHPYYKYRIEELEAKNAALERECEQLAKNAAMCLTDLERARR